jgi:hypothetical protein
LSVPWNRGTLTIVRRHGKQRPTPPRGRLRGHQMTREGNIYRDIISGSGPPWESVGPQQTWLGPPNTTRDLCVPLNRTRTPLSEVRIIHDKISGRRIPWPKSSTYMGPAQTLVRVLPGAPPLPAQAGTRCCHLAYDPWRKPAGRVWRKTSGPCDLCIYCGDRTPPVRPADRRCADSAFNVPHPPWWQATTRPPYRRRARPIRQQAVRPHCSTRAAVIMTCRIPRNLLLHANPTQATDVGTQGDSTRWPTLVAPGIPSVMSLGPHVGVRSLLYMPPFSYKRGGKQRYDSDST